MDANGIRRTTPKILPSFFFLTLTSILSCIAQSSHATLLTFDELEQPPCEPEGCFPLAINNQYSNLGITFVGGALYSTDTTQQPQIVSPFNALNDFNGPGLEIHFTGQTLPKAVGMYISAFNQDAVFLTVYGKNGQIDSAITDGWRGTEETSTPYRDQQLVTFANSDGIAQINLETLFSRRGTLIIDNLQFGDQISVPLPASLGLFVSCMGCLLLRKQKH